MTEAEVLAREKAKQAKIREIEELEREVKLKEGLPHIWSKKHYGWSREFLETTNPEAFLCAANQIGKSSALIRTCIEWATNRDLWATLWPNKLPNLFWYFYPDYNTASDEYKTKWQEFLPRGEMKNHPVYGWTAEMDKGKIQAINFRSGVRVVFKAYSQKKTNIQAGSVYAIFLDEECPIDYLPEIQLRLTATQGYLRAGFTATLGQDYWRRVFEPSGPDEELHSQAWKRQVSMFDCEFFEDGTKSHFTKEVIQKAIQKCGSRTEELRRVWGKFVKSGGLKFESFDIQKNTSEVHSLPRSWHVYCGIDYGSGGERGHPAAIVFIGVSPDYKSARVFKAWRGDDQITTAGDIILKYIEMRGGMQVVQTSYDQSAKDLHTIASSYGLTLTPANKKQDQGTELMNTLFRNEMLKVQRGDTETEKLIVELTSVLKTVSKTMAKDDLADATRYAVMPIPWNWEAIDDYLKVHPIEGEVLKELPIVVETDKQRRMRERRGDYDREQIDGVEQEMAAWNELYEN
jgi:hypothetical protein